MPTGHVKFWTEQRGFGFIAQDDGGPDLFVHFTAIEGEGHKNLGEGDAVYFDVTDSPKGKCAINVVKEAG